MTALFLCGMVKMRERREKNAGVQRGPIEAFYVSWIWRRAAENYRKKKIFCERCGEPGTQVHHRIRLTAANVTDPMIALDESNLELLCDECHEKEHGKRRWRAMPDGHVPL